MAEKPTLSDVFNAFAKKAIEDFPELKGELAIYHAPTDTLYGYFGSGQKNTLLGIGHKYLEEGKDRNLRACALAPSLHGKGHYLIEWFKDDLNQSSSIISTLKHELGHLIAPGGVHGANENFQECVADAFSFFYRQPEDWTEHETALSLRKDAVWSFIYGDMGHATFPVVQAAEELSASYNLSVKNLSPIEAANLAYRLALLYAPRSSDLLRMKEFFKPFNVHDKINLGDYRKRCLEIIREDHGKDSRMVFMMLKTCFAEENCFEDSAEERNIVAEMAEKEQALQKKAAAPEQRLDREARDMMALGRFDKSPDEKIDRAVYESKENVAYLNRSIDIYTAIRFHQETSAPLPAKIKKALSGRDAKTLEQDEIIALSRKLAVSKRLSSNPPHKTRAAI